MKGSGLLDTLPVRGRAGLPSGPTDEGPTAAVPPFGEGTPQIHWATPLPGRRIGGSRLGDRAARAPAAPVREVARFLVRGLLWAVTVFGVGLLVVVHGSALFGYRSLVVLSGSMSPTLATGDLVIEEVVRARDLQPGDIVSFRDPGDLDHIITHRLLSLTVVGSEINAVTKGDANTGVESWRIDTGGRMGRVVVRIPYLGYMFGWIQGPAGRILLVVVPALLLAGFALPWIWRPGTGSPRPWKIGPRGRAVRRGKAPAGAPRRTRELRTPTGGAP